MKAIKDLWRFTRLFIYWVVIPVYLPLAYLFSWVIWGLTIIHPDKVPHYLVVVTNEEDNLIREKRKVNKN